MNDPLDAAEPILETAEETAERLGFYAEIKRALVARGIPEEEITFIHDFPTAARKLQAFAEINAGRIRVLIASTDRAGCGANFQERLIAAHNLSIPWKPAELEQREGRIVRQGNIFPEVYICNYVTEGSFDAYQWQTIESKARFISQIMAGEVTARTAEDVDQLVMTAAQIKAIASGNPQILEKVAVEVELTKLERLYSAWSANRQRLRWQKESLPPHLDSVAREIAGHQKAIAARDQNEYDKFMIELRRAVSSAETITFTDRSRAGAHLRQLYFAV
ncbi:MAG: helicase-related protein, partial [Blastocatellia bacterium]